MSSLQLADDQHVRHIVDVLTGEFGGLLEPDHIAGEAERVYIDLRDQSRVESFVPILAMRRVRASLSVEAARVRRQNLPEDGVLVERVEHEPRCRGDVVALVDGPLEISRLEVSGDYVRYYGHWLDDDG